MTKYIGNLFLAVDAYEKLDDLDYHPAEEAYIWTLDNWFSYSFRRWIVDFLLTPFHVFFQILPFGNWFLNLLLMIINIHNVVIFWALY